MNAHLKWVVNKLQIFYEILQMISFENKQGIGGRRLCNVLETVPIILLEFHVERKCVRFQQIWFSRTVRVKESIHKKIQWFFSRL